MNPVPVGKMPLHLYLIRHGETEWVLTRQHTGTTEMPLTEHGAHEAQELGTRLRRIKFERVFSSPRQRARQTCALAGLAQAAVIDSDLSEWNYGDYEGMVSDQIQLVRPGWNIFEYGCPNGENPSQVSDRADGLIERLKLLSGNVALFTHGQFGCALAARWIGLHVADARHFALDTASFGILGLDPYHPDTNMIESWNTASHELPDAVADPELALSGARRHRVDAPSPTWISDEPPEDLRMS